VRFELGFETLKGRKISNRERKVVPNPRSTVEEGPFPILLLAILPNDEFQCVLVGSKTRPGWNLKLYQLTEVGWSTAIYTAVGQCCDFEIDAVSNR
jgi:hypothetical protein